MEPGLQYMHNFECFYEKVLLNLTRKKNLPASIQEKEKLIQD